MQPNTPLIPSYDPSLSVLVYSDQGADIVPFIATWPDPVAIDTDGRYNPRTGSGATRTLATCEIPIIQQLLMRLAQKDVTAKTLAFDNLSRISDAIRSACTYGNSRYYATTAQQLTSLVSQIRTLPLHKVFVARGKAKFADTASVVNGVAVAADDHTVIGITPDVDRAVLHMMDLVLELRRDELGRLYAVATGSKIPSIPVGRTWLNPLADDIIGAMAAPSAVVVQQLVQPAAPEPADPLTLQPTDPGYADIPHLTKLTAALNDALGLTDDARKSPRQYFTEWGLLTAKQKTLPPDDRAKAATRLRTAITKATAAKTTTQPSPAPRPKEEAPAVNTAADPTTSSVTDAQPIQADPTPRSAQPAPTRHDLKQLLSTRNGLIAQRDPNDATLIPLLPNYLRQHCAWNGTDGIDDTLLTLAKTTLEKEIAALQEATSPEALLDYATERIGAIRPPAAMGA